MKANKCGMDRRRALTVLGAGAMGDLLAKRRAEAAEAGLRFTGLDHVEFTVSDVDTSLAFYVQVFGNTVMKNKQTTRRYIKLGDCYIALDRTQDKKSRFGTGPADGSFGIERWPYIRARQRPRLWGTSASA